MQAEIESNMALRFRLYIIVVFRDKVSNPYKVRIFLLLALLGIFMFTAMLESLYKAKNWYVFSHLIILVVPLRQIKGQYMMEMKMIGVIIVNDN